MYYIGILSGTSLDAIDAAIVNFPNQNNSLSTPNIIANISHQIPNTIKRQCLEISTSDKCNIDQLGQLCHIIGKLFANTVLELLKINNIDQNKITAIGSHGINIRHKPDLQFPFTMQIGDPNIISEITGITTIADFRRRDLAASGQGAPLSPVFHEYLLDCYLQNNQNININKIGNKDHAIINIGGISNISFIFSQNKDTIGFDTGPGNCLIDSWCHENFNTDYDKNGEISKSGKIIEPLLEILKSDQYFNKSYPKSTGREYFNLKWLNSKLDLFFKDNPDQYKNIKTNKKNNSNLNTDILRTLIELTTSTIADQINNIQQKSCDVDIYVCGGGAKNTTLVHSLESLLNKKIKTTEEINISPEWMETALFAWLAKCNIENKTINLKNVTGGTSSSVLGGVWG